MGHNLGHKSPKGSVSITNHKGRIRLRWRCQGERYSLNLSSYDRANLLEAKKIALQIESDILDGVFDVSLNKYGSKPKIKPVQEVLGPAPIVVPEPPKVEIISSQKSIVQYFEDWTKNYRQMDCEVNSDYYHLRNALKTWGEVGEQNILEILNSQKYSPKTYNGRLSLLKSFAKWMVKKGVWQVNPLEDVSSRRAKKAVLSSREPFTEEEIAKILDAIRTDKYCPKSSRYTHSHYYPFIYFIFKTGVRPAEAVGLRVGSIDASGKTITIKEVMARVLGNSNAAVRKRKETKNGKIRLLPLTDDLAEILLPLVSRKQRDDLVFLSPTGLILDDRMFQRRVFKPVLEKLEIEYRVLYACRHTFGSRCIDSGITPVMTAFLMGNNPETALRNYTHQINIPKELPKIGD